MTSPLAAAQRDRLIEAMLPDVPFDGWSRAALGAGGKRAGLPTAEAMALFPGGAADLVAAFSRWADRRLLDRLEAAALADRRTAERIALAVAMRLDLLAPHREAARRAASVLAIPFNAPLATRLLYETVDAIWYAAGDSATDFSFYTKRATLAAIYAATVLYWLDDRSPEASDTRAFLERRLAGLAAFGRVRQRLAAAIDRLPNPLRLTRPTA